MHMKSKLFHLFTRHSLIRMQQRGKSADGIKMVLRYGVLSGDREEIMLRRRDADSEIEKRKRWLARLRGANSRKKQIALRRRIRTLEQMRGCSVIQKNNSIVTVYNRTRRRLSKRK